MSTVPIRISSSEVFHIGDFHVLLLLEEKDKDQDQDQDQDEDGGPGEGGRQPRDILPDGCLLTCFAWVCCHRYVICKTTRNASLPFLVIYSKLVFPQTGM